ncbi:MAG: deoxyribonuclease IV [Armatimonadetes bacterium]|nr:deoxyribonuclease IV [Armatimonadota bacterium]
MSAMKLGAHMPSAGSLAKTLQSGLDIGCTALQVFTSSPRQWAAKPVDPEAATEFRKLADASGLQPVISHDSYLINICEREPELRQRAINGLKAEMGRCAQYGIPLVVSHLGAWKGYETEEAALKVMAEGIKEILADTDGSVTLLGETTAGQGSSLNYRFEHLAFLIEALKGDARFGVCLDTCHIFVAGYDLRTDDAYDATWAAFDRIIGIKYLKAIHCNDSKKPFRSRVDRHEHIGKGEIGIQAFERLVNDPRFEQIPIVLETPDAPEGHVRNLNLLKSLRRP